MYSVRQVKRSIRIIAVDSTAFVVLDNMAGRRGTVGIVREVSPPLPAHRDCTCETDRDPDPWHRYCNNTPIHSTALLPFYFSASFVLFFIKKKLDLWSVDRSLIHPHLSHVSATRLM